MTVEPEKRCSEYNRNHYRYYNSVENKIVERDGGIVSPYNGEEFNSTYETQIEHMVALSEAHDSGMCRANKSARSAFASDIDNLTLASPKLNREKGAKDAAEWLPEQSKCWFVETVVAVKLKYNLSVDIAERDVLESVFSVCERSPSMELVIIQNQIKQLQDYSKSLQEELNRLKTCFSK